MEQGSDPVVSPASEAGLTEERMLRRIWFGRSANAATLPTLRVPICTHPRTPSFHPYSLDEQILTVPQRRDTDAAVQLLTTLKRQHQDLMESIATAGASKVPGGEVLPLSTSPMPPPCLRVRRRPETSPTRPSLSSGVDSVDWNVGTIRRNSAKTAGRSLAVAAASSSRRFSLNRPTSIPSVVRTLCTPLTAEGYNSY